jgi:CheY-like chemotaxis protein
MDLRGNILIVDDDDESIALLKVQLKDKPFKVYFVNSAQEGMDILEKEDIQIVMSDLHMPYVDGSHFLYEVRKKHPKTTRLVLSGNTNSDEILAAVNAGHIYSFIQKPWKKESLIIAIMNGLDVQKISSERDELLMRSHNLNTKLLSLNSEIEQKYKQKGETIEILNSNISKYIIQKDISLDSFKEFLQGIFCEEDFTVYRYTDDSKMSLLVDSNPNEDLVNSLAHQDILKIVNIDTESLSELLSLSYEPKSWKLDGMNRSDDFLLVSTAKFEIFEDYMPLIRLLLSKLPSDS